MSNELNFTLAIDDSTEDIESLKQEIFELNNEEDLPEIKYVKEESPSLGLVEALIISLAAKFLFELLKKVTPIAIKKLKNFIKKILEKKENSSGTKGRLTLHYEVLTLEFTLGNDKKIDQQIQKFIKYISE